jgi:DNA-binding CsgD family transcriptional regulator
VPYLESSVVTQHEQERAEPVNHSLGRMTKGEQERARAISRSLASAREPSLNGHASPVDERANGHVSRAVTLGAGPPVRRTQAERIWALSEVLRPLFLNADVVDALDAMRPALAELFLSRHVSVEVWRHEDFSPRILYPFDDDHAAAMAGAYRETIHTSPAIVRIRGAASGLVTNARGAGEALQSCRAFHEVFRQMGWKDQLSIGLHVRVGVLCISCFREQPFSDEELEFAAIVQRQMTARLKYLDDARLNNQVECWEIPMSDTHEPLHIEEPVAAVLAKYCPENAPAMKWLPHVVQSWIAAYTRQSPEMREAAMPLRLHHRDGVLVVSLVRSAARANVLVLREERSTIRLSRIQRWGLTERQVDVAFWLARGKTDGEVGHFLGISARTVSKHVEGVLAKLHCENRTAAAVQLVRALEQPDRHG